MRTWKRRLASKTTQYFVPNYKPNPNLMKNLWKSRAFFPPRSYQRNEISNSKQQRQRTWWRSHGKESFVKNHNISIKNPFWFFIARSLKLEKSIPKVIYASRTHSQLAQVVRELKRLREIGYEIKMSVLGGRGTTCLHSKVSKEKDNAIQQTMDSKYHLVAFWLVLRPKLWSFHYSMTKFGNGPGPYLIRPQ